MTVYITSALLWQLHACSSARKYLYDHGGRIAVTRKNLRKHLPMILAHRRWIWSQADRTDEEYRRMEGQLCHRTYKRDKADYDATMDLVGDTLLSWITTMVEKARER